MFITIDPYYDNQFFNESKEALKNNNIKYQTFISIKAPYDWYFQIKDTPILINYDVALKEQSRWLVNVINPVRPAEAYLLTRRNNDNGLKALLKFVENQPLKDARESDYAVFFTIKNREEGERLSKEYPGIIWYFGKFYKNKYRVCLGTHAAIKNFLSDDQILLEKGKEIQEPGRFEAEFNYRVFRGNDYLIKFTETAYFKTGQFKRPKIQGVHSSKFNI